MLTQFLLHNWYWCVSLVVSGIWLTVLMLREGSNCFSVSPQDAVILFNRERAIFIDLRDVHTETILNAKFVSFDNKEAQLQELDKAKKRPVIFFCAFGHRSLAMASRYRRTHDHVFSLQGGFQAWRDSGLPIVSMQEISHRS